MKKMFDLKFPSGFNPKTQKQVGLFVAQLDDQLKDLEQQVKGMTVKQLEWQLKPGMNTVGILLAHLALTELWWINFVGKGIEWKPEMRDALMKITGFDDDGIPLPKDGQHIKILKGYTVEMYIKVLKNARRSIKKEIKKWNDRNLDQLCAYKTRKFSRRWILYHLLEHFASHLGQVLLLKHMMVDAGVLKKKK